MGIASCGNGFFVYTPLIHRIRGAGTLCKLLDSVDEQKFTALEARKLVELISSSTTLSACDSNKAFVSELRTLAARERNVFDSISGQMRPYVNVREMQRLMKVGFWVNLFPCA